jgi:hypothetical protein
MTPLLYLMACLMSPAPLIHLAESRVNWHQPALALGDETPSTQDRPGCFSLFLSSIVGLTRQVVCGRCARCYSSACHRGHSRKHCSGIGKHAHHEGERARCAYG